jgi:capsular exopolysaccharide synthesis family protein
VDKEQGFIERAVRVARRRKWLILQATVAVPVIALLFSLSQTKEYTASATLLFREPPVSVEGSPQVVDPTREAETNNQLVALPVIADEAARLLGEEVPAGEIAAAIEVEPSLNADTANISATTEDPERSATFANAYGRAYISFRRKADRAQVQEAIDQAEASLEDLSPAAREGTEGQALQGQLDNLKLTQALQTGGAELVQPATPPSSPSTPKTTRNVALGIVLGLILGCALAALIESLDRRVRSAEEMEELYKLPVLAKIPRSRRLATRISSSMEPKTPEGEAFRTLRANLRYFNLSEEHVVILVVSPAEGDGKTTVAQGLATTMVEMGESVVLVEGDLRKGGKLRQADGRPAPGLSSVLAGTPIDNVISRLEVRTSKRGERRDLAILPGGPSPPNPAELLEGERMREVIAELKDRFQVVVLDSPAMGAVSDAVALIPMASLIIVVGGLGKTTRSQLQQVKNQFDLLGERPVGIVVNFTQSESARYSQYFRADSTEANAPVT